MSFEREAIVTDPSIIQATTLTREPKVFEPYKLRSTPPASESIGQADTRKTESVDTKPEDTVTLSPQAAQLARREQKFRQQQQQLEKDRAQLATEKNEIAQLKAMKEKLAAKDYSGLDELVDYGEYSQYQVNKLNGTDATQEELKKIHGKISEIEKRTEDNISKQFEAAVQERRIATAELVDKTDQFPRIKKAKAHEAVVQHILDTWEHDSQELSIEDAAKEVDAILLEKAKQWAALLEDQKETSQPQERGKPPLPPMKQGLRTLTNQVTVGDPVSRPQKALSQMSEDDRWAIARQRAKEKLQNNKRN